MLAQKLILSYSSRIFVQFFQIVASVIVARIAGPGVLGTVAFGLSYVTMFTFFADMGFGTAHMKKLSEGKDEARCIGTYARIKIGLVTFYVFCVVGFFLAQKNIFHVSFESKDHITVIFVLLVSTTLAQLFTIPKTTFSAYAQKAKSDIPDLIQTLLYQFLRIIIVLFGFRAVALAFGNIASMILVLPVFIYLFKDYKIGPFDKNLAKEYLKIALPVMLTAITSKLYSTIDKVLLQFFTNSEQVGYYTAGFRMGGFVLLIANSIGVLFFPIFSKAASQKDYASIKRHIDKFERFSFIYIMPFLILVTLFSRDIVYLILGKEYISSVPIMIAINIAMFLRVINTPYSSVIVGLGYFNKGLQIGIYHFVFYIVILFVLIDPSFLNMSGLGAAIAILLANLFLLTLYRIYARKYLPILSNKIAILYMIYGTVNYILFFIILNKTMLFQGYYKILFIFVYIFVTYFSMSLFKLVNKGDWKYLKTLVDYQKMNKYIKGEIFK